MTLENFGVLIEKLHERRPFQPFTIQLSDGERFEVDHPSALGYRLGESLVYFIAPGGVPFWFDHESVSTIIDNTANTVA
ncbi:MAG: hypothetical protein ACKV2Q_04355 [Planctomycetaceae bacterium]